MKFKKYMPLAIRTCKELPFEQHVTHMALGIAGEFGELVDVIKKIEVYGKPVDKVKIADELSDALWYATNLAYLFDGLHGYLDGDEMMSMIDIEELHKAREALPLTILANNCVFAEKALKMVLAAQDSNLKELESLTRYVLLGLFATAVLLDIDLGTAMDANIAKLAARYGDKYSDYNATNRDLLTEQVAMESKS